ncbi:MAG: large conductance mechanosensitive channel protein MscL [Thermomicrobiales bacterium]
MFDGFKKFIMRGNVVDLAVAVVIGAAFTQVVNSLVEGIINPLLAAIVGKPNFDDLTITIRDSTIMYGTFLTAVINFLLVAAAIYFIIVKPMNMALDRLNEGKGSPDPDTKQCPECLSEIPVAATRCAHCGISLVGLPPTT